MKSWIQLAQQQSKTFELAIPLTIGETYTISMNSNEPFIISVGDVVVGETVDGSLEFIATNSGDVTITSYSDISMEFEIKLELGSTPTKWSPAPEDGYGLDLPNGAYHIQGQGNFSNILDLPNAQSSVDIHNWGDATLNGETLALNETTHYTSLESQLDFNGELDFIASDPSITTSNASPYDGTTLQFSNLELIRNNREENISKLFNEVQGLSYERTTIEYVGDPAIEVGDILDYLDRDGNPRKIYVTGLEFRDNGAFNGVLHAHILTSEESHSNFVGDYTKNLKTTRIEVDKVNQTVDVILGDIDDLNDKTAQLHIDVDNITSTVENISNGNLLTNGSGELGFLGWTGASVAKYVKEILEARTTDLRYLDNLRYNMGFVPMYNSMSLSEWDISFYNNGFDVSPIAFIVPDIDHSYRAKVSKFKPFNIDVLEFNDLNRANALTADKVTNFAFNSPMDYVQFTFTPSASTQYVRFKYNRTGITTSDRLNIAEVMFNRGQPKEWQPSPNNAITYTRSSITQLANEIELKVDTDGVISAINLTSEQAKILANHISLEGLTTINGNFKVLPNGDVEFTNATGTNVNLSGKITTNDLTATGGTIGNMSIENGSLTYTTPTIDYDWTQGDVSLVRLILLGTLSATAYHRYIYDVNNDGEIDIVDLGMIQSYLLGIGAKPIKKVKKRVIVGTNNASVQTQVLYGANDAVGSTTTMNASEVTTSIMNTQGLSIGGKAIEVDENGFLKIMT